MSNWSSRKSSWSSRTFSSENWREPKQTSSDPSPSSYSNIDSYGSSNSNGAQQWDIPKYPWETEAPELFETYNSYHEAGIKHNDHAKHHKDAVERSKKIKGDKFDSGHYSPADQAAMLEYSAGHPPRHLPLLKANAEARYKESTVELENRLYRDSKWPQSYKSSMDQGGHHKAIKTAEKYQYKAKKDLNKYSVEWPKNVKPLMQDTRENTDPYFRGKDYEYDFPDYREEDFDF